MDSKIDLRRISKLMSHINTPIGKEEDIVKADVCIPLEIFS